MEITWNNNNIMNMKLVFFFWRGREEEWKAKLGRWCPRIKKRKKKQKPWKSARGGLSCAQHRPYFLSPLWPSQRRQEHCMQARSTRWSPGTISWLPEYEQDHSQYRPRACKFESVFRFHALSTFYLFVFFVFFRVCICSDIVCIWVILPKNKTKKASDYHQ